MDEAPRALCLPDDLADAVAAHLLLLDQMQDLAPDDPERVAWEARRDVLRLRIRTEGWTVPVPPTAELWLEMKDLA